MENEPVQCIEPIKEPSFGPTSKFLHFQLHNGALNLVVLRLDSRRPNWEGEPIKTWFKLDKRGLNLLAEHVLALRAAMEGDDDDSTLALREIIKRVDVVLPRLRRFLQKKHL